MFAERVQDMAGRRWFIERRFSPWRLVVRPDAVLYGKYPRRTPTLPPRDPEPPRRSRSRKENAALAALLVLSLPEAVMCAVIISVLFACVVPFMVAEVVVRAVASLGLAAARAAGLARHRGRRRLAHRVSPALGDRAARAWWPPSQAARG